jgi:methylglutaconyl-CoA hydratase
MKNFFKSNQRPLFKKYFTTGIQQECTLNRLTEEKYKGISVISFNRPKAKNALGKQLVEELSENLKTVRFDKETRVLIIKSEVPGIFCSGADLKERATMTQSEGEAFVYKLRSLFNEVEVHFKTFLKSIEHPNSNHCLYFRRSFWRRFGISVKLRH